jgi:ADP-ribosyl-[dinitrogen reductase] hydrolase
VTAGPGLGRIGITFCPGKKDPAAMSGPWDRDLALDLAAIRAWGAALVVTLTEARELRLLGVPHLGEAVRAHGMDWLHLPIRDVAVPDAAFEAAWAASAGAAIRARLRAGERVLVHCRGGLGRAGTIAARLLAELGTPPEEAIARVRAARPGAIETPEQEAHVRACRPVPPRDTAAASPGAEDRAVGALLGLAVGDAVGTTLEFAARDSRPPLTDMVGGGPFRLAPGQWTDDTAMALALADSLLARGGLDEQDLLRRFLAWYERGAYSCTGTCFDIGITTREALARFRRSGADHPGPTDPDKAGNGSLMRLAPVALRFRRDRAALRDAAARQSRTTHGAAEAVDACIAFAELLADAIAGAPREAVLRPRPGPYAGAIGAIMAGSWRGKARRDIRASGYVAHALEAALWCVAQAEDFRAAVLLAANLGEDADTTAAIAGQLAGALHGATGIPAEWRARLAWAGRIEQTARALFAAG